MKTAETRKKRRRAVWYENGLRFRCTMCGHCCTNHGDSSYVFLTTAELVRLATALDLEVTTFKKRYTTRVDGYLVLRDAGDRCVLLGADSRCTAYDARPRQCRSWPFGPSTRENETSEDAVQSICPGAGRGTLYSFEEIHAIALWSESEEDEELPGPCPCSAPRR